MLGHLQADGMAVMMTIFDFARSLESVVAEERKQVYPIPLKVSDEVELFTTWMADNPEAISAMDAHALDMQERKGACSAKHLFEWLRWETDIKLVPCYFWDDQGKRHRFGISNTLSALYGRRLKDKYHLTVETKGSRFDELTPSQMKEVCR